MWRTLRIALLALVLVLVAGHTLLDRLETSDWDRTLWIGIFPINADGSAAARRYIGSLDANHYAPIENFFAREARRHGLALEQPLRIDLHPPLHARPPQLAPGAGPLATAWWSLELRLFAWRRGSSAGRARPHIRVFVMLHDPAATPRVPHSRGMQKGLVGVVHAFADADMRGGNDVVIAHEVLHTLGASDKYDPVTGLPVYPDGYGEPQREPRHPQRLAEIMAGRIALSPHTQAMADDLGQAVIGEATGREIGWLR